MQQQAACPIHGRTAIRDSSPATCSSASAFPWPASPTRTARSASGTTRATSALDANCRAHEVDNLYVVDGSFFPSSGAVNPALTIMANALRVGDHLLERLGRVRRSQATAAARGGRGMKQHLALLALLVAPVLHAQEAQHPWQGKGRGPAIHGRVVRR